MWDPDPDHVEQYPNKKKKKTLLIGSDPLSLPHFFLAVINAALLFIINSL